MKKFLFALFALFACSMASAGPAKKIVPNNNYTNGEKDIIFTYTNAKYDALNIDLWVYVPYDINGLILAERVDTANNIKLGETVKFTIDKSFYNKEYRSQIVFYDAKTGDVINWGTRLPIKDLDGEHFEY